MMHKVKSGNIAAVGHDGKSLHVEFTNGSKYRYDGVPSTVARDLRSAKSVGQHFMVHVRNKFKGVKVE